MNTLLDDEFNVNIPGIMKEDNEYNDVFSPNYEMEMPTKCDLLKYIVEESTEN